MTQLGSILVHPEVMFHFGINAWVEINNLYLNWH